jgi:exonuclease VII small subunit
MNEVMLNTEEDTSISMKCTLPMSLYQEEERDDVNSKDRFTFDHDTHSFHSPSKNISISRAQLIYERGILYQAETRKKVNEELERLQSPSKQIPLSKATAVYERGKAFEAKRQEKLEVEISSMFSSPSKMAIPLSKASDLYERSVMARTITLQRIEEAKQKELASLEERSTENKVAIPLSRASALYDRGLLLMKETQRKISEQRKSLEGVDSKTPTKTIPISKGTRLYDEGMRLKAELDKKRKEESMKKKWR